MLSELRDRLRGGDVWFMATRRFRLSAPISSNGGAVPLLRGSPQLTIGLFI